MEQVPPEVIVSPNREPIPPFEDLDTEIVFILADVAVFNRDRWIGDRAAIALCRYICANQMELVATKPKG